MGSEWIIVFEWKMKHGSTLVHSLTTKLVFFDFPLVTQLSWGLGKKSTLSFRSLGATPRQLESLLRLSEALAKMEVSHQQEKRYRFNCWDSTGSNSKDFVFPAERHCWNQTCQGSHSIDPSCNIFRVNRSCNRETGFRSVECRKIALNHISMTSSITEICEAWYKIWSPRTLFVAISRSHDHLLIFLGSFRWI